MTPTIKCAACNGKGYRKLSGPLHRALHIIQRSPKPISIPELISKLGESVGDTAINKRVNSLVAMKLVKVRKSSPGVRRFVVNGKH